MVLHYCMKIYYATIDVFRIVKLQKKDKTMSRRNKKGQGQKVEMVMKS